MPCGHRGSASQFHTFRPRSLRPDTAGTQQWPLMPTEHSRLFYVGIETLGRPLVAISDRRVKHVESGPNAVR